MWRILPQRNEGGSIVGLQFPPVDPPGNGVNGICGVLHHHGGTLVVLKQGAVLVEESAVWALQDLPSALRPHGADEKLPKKSGARVLFGPMLLQYRAHKCKC